jgi:hypothetical protein
MMHFFYADLSTEEQSCGLASLACSPTEKTPETASNVIHSLERGGLAKLYHHTDSLSDLQALLSLRCSRGARSGQAPCFRGKVLRGQLVTRPFAKRGESNGSDNASSCSEQARACAMLRNAP